MWGGHVQLWSRMLREGKTPPLQFFEKPEIELWNQVYWDGFVQLSTERQLGFGAIGHLPRSKVRDYAKDELGLTDEEGIDRFCRVIRLVDDDYVTMVNAPRSKEGARYAAKVDDTRAVRAVFDFVEARLKARENESKPHPSD